MKAHSLACLGAGRGPAVVMARRMAATHPRTAALPSHRCRLAPPAPQPRLDGAALLKRPDWQQAQPAEAPAATPERREVSPGRAEQQAARLKQYPWLSDEWKEEYRRQVRVSFDFERWRTHRSASRYIRHMLSLGQSQTMAGVLQPMTYVMGVAVAVAAWHVAAAAGSVPMWPALKLAASAPFGLISFALSVLLVFRTNSSYGRFDEARKMIGLVVNSSRDLARQALGYIPPHQSELQAAVCRWTLAYTRSLMCHVREGDDLATELREVLPPGELEELLAAQHRPNFCCQMLTEALREAQLLGGSPSNLDSRACIPAGAAYRMDENVSVFNDVAGGCERLLRTPIPLAYTRHTSRFMMIWLTLLPFTLWDTCGWAMLPVIAVVSFLLLGIEEIGVSIEEPFSILPLENICATIERNVREMVASNAARQARRAQQQQQQQQGGGHGQQPQHRHHAVPVPAELVKRRGAQGGAAAPALAPLPAAGLVQP